MASKNIIDNKSSCSKQYHAVEFCQKFVKCTKLEFDKMKHNAENSMEEFDYYVNELKDGHYHRSLENYRNNKLKTLEELIEDVEMTKPIKDSIVSNLKNIEKMVRYFNAFTKKTFNCFDGFDRNSESLKVMFENIKNRETIEAFITNLSSEYPKIVNDLYEKFIEYLIGDFKPSTTLDHTNDRLHDFIKTLSSFKFENKNGNDMTTISDIFVSFDDLADYIWLCRNIANTNIRNIDFIYNHLISEAKRIIDTPLDINVVDNINSFIEFTLNFTYSIINTLSRIYSSTIMTMSIIRPSQPLKTDNSVTDTIIKKSVESISNGIDGAIMSKIESIDPYISTDYHLLKELNKNETTIIRTEAIIKKHNEIVKPNDVFLYLGDLSESEFTDIKNEKYRNLLLKFVKKLNGKKILVVGNNDTGDDEFYKKCGFVEIYRAPVETNNYIFSHEPIISKTKLNIHGHIHGNHRYYSEIGINNHVDAYYDLHGGPIKLSELVKYYKTGKYSGCFISETTWDKPRKDNKIIDMQSKEVEE